MYPLALMTNNKQIRKELVYIGVKFDRYKVYEKLSIIGHIYQFHDTSTCYIFSKIFKCLENTNFSSVYLLMEKIIELRSKTFIWKDIGV